jgi:hypothetical protein
MINIDKYGNTTTATIPLCLWDYEHKLKAGDRLVLVAFGGGFRGAASISLGHTTRTNHYPMLMEACNRCFFAERQSTTPWLFNFSLNGLY